MRHIIKCKKISLFLISTIIIGCNSGVNSPDKQGSVVLSSPTVEPDGNLSIHATARFDVEVTGLEDDQQLTYDWSLQEARGTLVVDGQDKGRQTQSSSSFVMVRGDKAGEETLRVKVLDKETGNSIGEDILSFKITLPDGGSQCFNEPLLFFRNNIWEDPTVTAIGLQSDTRKVTKLSPNNWLMDISPDGKWFLRQDFTDAKNYAFWLDACDGSESKLLVEGQQIEIPSFGPNGQYVYYSALIDYPEQTQDPRAAEIVRLNIETGAKDFLTDYRVFSRNPKVSPDDKWIAFEYNKETFDENGSYAGSIIHIAVISSKGGSLRFLTEISGGRNSRVDWSPDSKDMIFYFAEFTENNGPLTQGIYRVYLDGGGNPSLLFGEAKGNGSPHNISYYANGTRIAFDGIPAGNDTQYDVWSIDANGGDLQRLTDERYNVLLSFIWEPK